MNLRHQKVTEQVYPRCYGYHLCLWLHSWTGTTFSLGDRPNVGKFHWVNSFSLAHWLTSFYLALSNWSHRVDCVDDAHLYRGRTTFGEWYRCFWFESQSGSVLDLGSHPDLQPPGL